jgi:hypothetical protein
VKSSTLKERGEEKALKECGEEKARKAFHPKCKNERRKVRSLLSLNFFFFFSFFLSCLRIK